MKTQRPILFSTPMVKALLAGKKTQTRRTVKSFNLTEFYEYHAHSKEPNGENIPVPADGPRPHDRWYQWTRKNNNGDNWILQCPYGEPGDILYVRETLFQNGELGLEYVADKEAIDEEIIPENHKPYRDYAFCKIPNIHMPKWAARLWLKIKEVRVERVQQISGSDAMNEGVETEFNVSLEIGGSSSFHQKSHEQMAKEYFQSLWYKINGSESWNANPWVWIIEFEIIEKPGGDSHDH